MVPNHLLDRLADFSLAEVRVLLCVSRHTHGFHNAEIEMGRRRLAKRTGLHTETLALAVKSLKKRGELTVRAGLRGRGIYSIPSRPDCAENPLSGMERDCTENPLSQPVDCAENPLRSERKFRSRLNKPLSKKEADLKESAQQHHLLLKDMLGREPSADDVECLHATLAKFHPEVVLAGMLRTGLRAHDKGTRPKSFKYFQPEIQTVAETMPGVQHEPHYIANLRRKWDRRAQRADGKPASEAAA